jgi:Pentapeptide repeats (8 copies)
LLAVAVVEAGPKPALTSRARARQSSSVRDWPSAAPRQLPEDGGVWRSIREWWSSLERGDRLRLLVVAVPVLILVVLLLALALTFLPLVLALIEGLHGNDKVEEADRIRTALLALGAGLVAIVGAYFTYRTFKLNSSGQITDRFSRAIGELGDPNPRVCLGGIYALERIARDSREDHPQVMEVLTAYLRAEVPKKEAVQARLPWKDGWTAYGPERPPNEVQATLAVLGRRNASWDKHRLDLSAVRLRGVKLPKGADLRGVILNNACLDDALLERVHFTPRQFPDGCWPADLTGAHLEGAHLEGADLRRATLSGAKLNNAHLEAADLTGADLDAAEFEGAWVNAETKPETFRTIPGLRVSN